MEPDASKQPRVALILGKFRVIEKQNNSMKIALGGSTTMTATLPPYVDVREGDLLTFYTEVLYAPPDPTSVQ